VVWIVDYDQLCSDAESELSLLLKRLSRPMPAEEIGAAATDFLDPKLNHGAAPDRDATLPPAVAEMYRALKRQCAAQPRL
jgi:hypothetical protein